MLCAAVNGRISRSISGEMMEYGGCSEVTGAMVLTDLHHRARRGDHGMRAGLCRDGQFQAIASGDPTGRMHQRRMARARAFRIERLLHQQRPVVEAVCEHGALTLTHDPTIVARGVTRATGRIDGRGLDAAERAGDAPRLRYDGGLGDGDAGAGHQRSGSSHGSARNLPRGTIWSNKLYTNC